jgi:hypothetical protein
MGADQSRHTVTRISFLVPTFNRAAFLGEALDAILSQKSDDDELLVIDDGSIDSTLDVVRSAGARVRYLRQNNAGKSVALNRGLAETNGEFVFICDDDDRLRPGAVELLLNAISETPAGFVFGRYTRFEQRSGRDLGVGYWPDLRGGSILRHVLEDAFVMQNASLVRRSALEAIGPFSESMKRSMDYEMFVRLACSAPARFVDAVIFDQRKHQAERGPAADMHPASASMKVWRKFDRAIFQNFYHKAPLQLLEAMFDAPTPAQRSRAALLQRAAIMARHDCWELACDDIDAAAAIAAWPLDAGEYRICNRALGGKHGVTGLTAPAVARRLNDAGRRSDVGRQIVDGLLAGGLWRLRGGDAGQARAVLSAVAKIAPMRAPFIVLGHKAAKSRAAVVEERPELPSAAYLKPGTIPPTRE